MSGSKVKQVVSFWTKEFCPGEPYLFAKDPDGYEIEIWYES
jgi:hypothetical protein